MNALQALQTACEPRNFKSFKDLEVGEYPVRGFSLVNTQHGQRLRVDLEDCYLFLPERFVLHMNADFIAKLNSTKKLMVYSGKDLVNKQRYVSNQESE